MRPAPARPRDEAPSKGLRVFGSLLAPTTVLTALLFYFGTRHATYFCRRFGVHYSVLGLSAPDYLIRSSDGMFVPLTVLAAMGLATLWGYRFLHSALAPRTWRALTRRAVPVLVSLGGVLLLLGLAGLAVPTLLYAVPGLPGLCVALGVILFPVAEHLHATRSGKHVAGVVPVIQWTFTFVLASIGLFWAVTDYSAAVGDARGYEYETKLGGMPETVVFTTKDIGVRGPGVTMTTCTAADTAYKFRYDGLVLVLQSGGQSFLLPKGWNSRDGVALVLPRSNDVRLEFSPADAQRDRSC
ncbi:hypothetical protein SAMN04488564_102723 [Lentzea waywayandensis]|uniref:Uncharacterized protein n=1 Tax=Lentzea waywayandensis TaxID=84724 RepID=A0A1I6DIJ6_9PSEU|nr:hypothetical protein [Lentzea waywayandensis]SFR05218.1 hypothetical protein SAMN04488564_102723 [Lentzea waywayandensis]